MKYRTLGQGLEVSALGIGCMPMVRGGNIVYGGDASEDESIATIHRAIDLGITFFDTAEMYGPFSNEELVGEAIKARGSGARDGLVIATKFAIRWNGATPVGIDGSPENARRACEGSLKRLGIETIDLFYQHRVDPNTPIEETIGGMADLVREGKVRHIGLSEAGPETIRRAAAVHPIAALQSEYSLWEREVEDEIVPVCRELGIGFVPYSPLGRGFLTGRITRREDLPADDWRRGDPRYSEENFGANLKIVDAIRAVADRHGVSLAQVALAWLLAQGPDIVPIPGVKRRATLEDSAGAVDLELSGADLEALDAARAVAGNRYNEEGMKRVRL
jgi:aryl-alcohol dehydrogenase-like predicted oxidoreductase